MLRSRYATRFVPGRSKSEPSVSAPSGPTMLVVEDDPETRRTLAAELRGQGYDVVEASDRGGARDCIADRRLVIVLTTETATRLGERGTSALVESSAVDSERRGGVARRRAGSRRSAWERDGHVV